MEKYLICWCANFILCLMIDYTSSFAPIEDVNDDKILDMDDLMEIQYRTPSKRRMIVTPNQQTETILNMNQLNDDKTNDIVFNQWRMPYSKIEEEQYGSIVNRDDESIGMLENVVINPAWLTKDETQDLDGNNKMKLNEKSDIVKFKRLQSMLKDKFCKGNNNRRMSSHVWPNISEADEKSLENNIPDNNGNEAAAKVLYGQKINNQYRHNFEQENQLVVQALNGFYKRLFDSLTEVVPNLMFEDPFLTDFSLKTKLLNNLSSTTILYDKTAVVGDTELDRFINKKLESWNKQQNQQQQKEQQSTKQNGMFDMSLTNILDQFPNLLLMPYTTQSSSDTKSYDNNNIFDGKSNENVNDKTKQWNPTKTDINQLNNLLSYIPQIHYKYEPLTANYSNSTGGNRSTILPKIWYYSNYYTETPITTALDATTNSSSNAVENSQSITWTDTKINDLIKNKYKSFSNINNFLHKNNIDGRIEWESSSDDIPESETELLTTNMVAYNPTTTPIPSIHFDGDPFWVNDPFREHMMEYLLNNDNKQLDNKLFKYSDGNTESYKGRYSALGNSQPINSTSNNNFYVK